MPATARANGSPYNHHHRKTRAALIPAAIGTPCPGDWINGQPYRSRNCVGVMTNPAHMHLAHTTPVALGGTDADVINCAACNLGAGATLGNQLRAPTPRHTRDW
jgi:hypothetical protein